MDRAWWHEYAEELERFTGECWTTNPEAARIYRLNLIRGVIGAGIPRSRPNSITLGGNSGYQAVALAVHFGAARIVLLGYDMRNDGRRTHWHGNHARLGNPVDVKFQEWCGHFHTLARDVGDRCRIENATRVTALDVFPKVTLLTALGETASIEP
jgi:hypothetical protein